MRTTPPSALAVLFALPVGGLVGEPDPPPGTHGSSNGSSFVVEAAEQGLQNEGSGVSGSASADTSEPSFSAGANACAGAQQVIDNSGGPTDLSFCVAEQQAAEPVLTVGLIRRAFAELPLPAGELVIQPPDGLTLVNFDTNFYTTSTRPIRRTVTLLGQRVTLEATPATFHWDFDDGRSLATSEPGAPYPRLDVTHNYLRTGTYRPSLSTTYSGRFRVGGGAWQQIPGTVTIDGAGQALRAIEAEPKLVGY